MAPTGDLIADVRPARVPSRQYEVNLSHTSQFHSGASRIEEAREVWLDYDSVVEGIDFEVPASFDSSLRFFATTPLEGGPCRRCDVQVARRHGKLATAVARGQTGKGEWFATHGLSKSSYTISGGIRRQDYRPAFVFQEDFEVTEAGEQALSVPAMSPVLIDAEVEFRDPPQTFAELTEDEARVVVHLYSAEGQKLGGIFSEPFAAVGVGRETRSGTIPNVLPGLNHTAVNP